MEVVDNRERERKIRREIANSNERRRMQSINSGFQALRLLIPHSEGEKLSKVCTMQKCSTKAIKSIWEIDCKAFDRQTFDLTDFILLISFTGRNIAANS